MRLKQDYTRHIYLKSASLCARAGLHIAKSSLYFMHTHTYITYNHTHTHTSYQRIYSYNQCQLENNQVAMNLSFCVFLF